LKNSVQINEKLVHNLIFSQFPKLADLKIKAVSNQGWDNRTFHLGDNMLVRLPSDAMYASQVKKEYYWLPKLRSCLPLEIPKPIAMGNPTPEYPFHWLINEWLEGDTSAVDRIDDLGKFAISLAEFIKSLHQCDTKGAPLAGPDNFYRGGSLSIYDADTRKAIAQLKDKNLSRSLTAIWEKALSSSWEKSPVWVHGDIAIGNLLVTNGKLSAVIDFGQLAIGDPACDLVIYWTFLSGESQGMFRKTLNLDNDTWDRARGWALWKILCAPIAGTDCGKIIDGIIAE